MTERLQMQVLFHGTVLVLAAMLSGVPLAAAIVDDAGREVIHAWGVTHASLASAGILLIAIAGVARQLVLPGRQGGLFTWTLVLSTYALCMGLVVSAASGHRGMTLAGPALNVVLYGLNIAGVLGALGAGVLLARGARGALRAAPRPHDPPLTAPAWRAAPGDR